MIGLSRDLLSRDRIMEASLLPEKNKYMSLAQNLIDGTWMELSCQSSLCPVSSNNHSLGTSTDWTGRSTSGVRMGRGLRDDARRCQDKGYSTVLSRCLPWTCRAPCHLQANGVIEWQDVQLTRHWDSRSLTVTLQPQGSMALRHMLGTTGLDGVQVGYTLIRVQLSRSNHCFLFGMKEVLNRNHAWFYVKMLSLPGN